MRSLIAAMLACVLAAPFFVAAQGTNPPALIPGKCPQGTSTGDPTGEQVFSDGSTNSGTIDQFMKKKVYCPNACFDMRITITRTEVNGKEAMKFAVRATNVCTDKAKAPKDQLKPRGCAAGETQPMITIDVPEISSRATGVLLRSQTLGPKSRCNADAVTTTVNDMFSKIASACATFIQQVSGECTGTIRGMQSHLDAFQALPQTTEPQTLGAVTANQSLITAFTQTGIPAAQAAQLVNNNPIAAANYINAIAQNNAPQIAANAALLNLSPTVTSAQQQAVLQAVQQTAPQATPHVNQQPTAASTFPQGVQDIERAKCAIATIESGSCGGNYYLRGPITQRGDRAYGKYQVMGANVPSWTMRSCGRAYTPEAFLRDTQCQERVFEVIFSEHVRSCGSYEAAASKWFSGRCQITNSTDGYTSVANYVRRFAAVFGSGTMPFGSQASLQTFGQSPFSQVNPFGEITNQSITCGDRYCYLQNWQGGPVPTGSPVSTGSSAGVQPLGNTGVTTAGTSSAPKPPITPVASLIVQPTQIARGSLTVVSWTSVGMKSAPPCRMTVASTTSATLADANEGTRAVRLGSTGTYTFTLLCSTPVGAEVRQAASVLVQ